MHASMNFQTQFHVFIIELWNYKWWIMQYIKNDVFIMRSI